VWGKAQGSALNFLPGRRTENEYVVREESLSMRRTEAMAVKRDASRR